MQTSARQNASTLPKTPSHRHLHKIWFWFGLFGLGFWGFQGCSVIKMHQAQLRNELKGGGIHSHRMALRVGDIQYMSGGDGFTILFVHGFGADAPETWKKQLLSFAKQYRVFAPDLFWFGKSKPNASHPFETPLEQARALIEFMDRHSLAKAHVVGVSFGGYIALQMALNYPQRIARLVLVDAAGLQPTPQEETQMRQHFAYANGDIPTLLIPKNTDQLKIFLDRVFYKPRYIPGFALKEILELEFWKNKEAKARIARHLRRNFLTPAQLEKIKRPTLVVWGRHDRLLLPTLGKRLTQSIPGAKMVWMEQSGHIPMLEQPEDFNRALRTFLEAHSK